MINHNNLEEFQDPENYDLEEEANTKPAARFYGELAEEIGGSVLEVACGTGLVTIPVALRGLDTTGVDVCRPMLNHANTKSQKLGLDIKWIEGDARWLSLSQKYDFIYMTGNAFQAFLGRKDQNDLLHAVESHLAKNGVFAFETRNPTGHDLSSYSVEKFWNEYVNANGNKVSIYDTQNYDSANQIMHWTSIRRWQDASGTKERVSRIACRFTCANELSQTLADSGYEVVEQFGGWDRSELRQESKSIVLICRVSS